MSGNLIYNLKRKHDELIASDNNATTRNENDKSAVVVSVSELSEKNYKNEIQIKYHRNDGSSSSSENSDKSLINDTNVPNNANFLQAALIKVQELENELAELNNCDSANDDANSHSSSDSGQEDEIDEENQLLEYESEALGFAVCARETLLFLENQGLARDNPLIISLRNRLIGKCNGIPI